MGNIHTNSVNLLSYARVLPINRSHLEISPMDNFIPQPFLLSNACHLNSYLVKRIEGFTAIYFLESINYESPKFVDR